MTPEHGYLFLAIGAALFASLLVAWLWGRRRAYMRRRDSAVRELVGHADRLGEPRLAVALNYAFAPTADIEAENARLRECYPLDASEERVKALEKDVGKLNDWANGINARLEAVDASSPLYEDRLRDTTLTVREERGVQYVRIEGWKPRLEAGAPTVAGLTEDQWNTPPRVVLREAVGEGDG